MKLYNEYAVIYCATDNRVWQLLLYIQRLAGGCLWIGLLIFRIFWKMGKPHVIICNLICMAIKPGSRCISMLWDQKIYLLYL